MKKVIVKTGKELTQEELEVINKWREKEFKSSCLIDPKPNDENWEKVHFLLKGKNGDILAFGRLHEVEVEFMGMRYLVLGIASIFSTERKKGYGRALMSDLVQYVQKNGKSAFGFCNAKTTPFYEKCGCGIIKSYEQRFLYKDPKGRLVADKRQGDLIFIDGEDHLMEKIVANPLEKVFIFRPYW